MHLVADGGGLEIHRTARVLPVFKNTDNGFLIPTVRISRYFLLSLIHIFLIDGVI